jgi:hypothetical protein
MLSLKVSPRTKFTGTALMMFALRSCKQVLSSVISFTFLGVTGMTPIAFTPTLITGLSIW